MDKRYRDKGLVVIGDEVQGSTVADIEEVAKDNRVEFTITKGTTRSPSMQGIPHVIVFAPSGEAVFAGHPADDDFERAVKKALKDVGEIAEEGDEPAEEGKPVIEERSWTNAEGKTIRAAVLRVEGDKVVFKMGSKEIPYPLEKLSEEDQKAITEATEKKSE